jgi:hypothetical protein
MVTKLNPLLSKADWYRYCIHLGSLNVHHFKMVEAMGLKKFGNEVPSKA